MDSLLGDGIRTILHCNTDIVFMEFVCGTLALFVTLGCWILTVCVALYSVLERYFVLHALPGSCIAKWLQ